MLHLAVLLFSAIFSQASTIKQREITLNKVLSISQSFHGLVIDKSQKSLIFWSDQNLVQLRYFILDNVRELIHAIADIVVQFPSE